MWRKFSIILMTWLAFSPSVCAQEDYRFDFGGGTGISGYLGDANTSGVFATPGAEGHLCFSYLATYRWAFKTRVTVESLRGNTASMVGIYPDIEPFRFATTCWQLTETAEFNFFAFGIGPTYRKMKSWTPYLTAGLGAAVWRSDRKTNTAPVLPLGIGVKYKPMPRLNLALEFLMTKVFSDRLDSKALDDPEGIKSAFIKNTDWCARLAISVSWEFSKRCAACNYKD